MGWAAESFSMKCPNSLSSSSPTGRSRLSGCQETRSIQRTLRAVDVHFAGDFFGRGLVPVILFELARDAIEAADAVAHVDGNADRAPLIGNGAGDGLANPPGRIGAEAEAPAIIEFFDGFHQAEVAFLNQIEEGDAACHIFLGNRDHQAGIGFDQVFAGTQAIVDHLLKFVSAFVVGVIAQFARGFVAGFQTHRQIDFLFGVRSGTRAISLRYIPTVSFDESPP